MGLYAALEAAISIAFLGGSLWLAIAQPVPEFVVLAIGIWIVTLAALIWSWKNRVGTWAASTSDTIGFLELSLRRCRARLAAIRYGFYLWTVEVILLAIWHTWFWSRHQPAPSLEAWLLAALLPVAFLAALLVLRRYWRLKLARLEELERGLIG